MPLVRVEVRNEYGLGAPELFAVANKEDPKEVLEGVAVAGLVGILRQLGDLAEFAAEVFHGLQEQVMTTSSRSHKLMRRVKQIEAALPPLEKLVLAQRSHLHFAYTAGANWHVRLRCQQSHFVYNDLPRFIQDSYEQCQGPPHLNLLDKFDPGGPGSCLKRYSDPSFFRRASTGSDVAYSDKVLKDKKGRKIKKRRSGRKNGEVLRGPSMSNYGRRIQCASPHVDGQTSPSQTVSTFDALKSELGDHPISLDSRNGSVDFERVSHPRFSMQQEEQEFKESSSSSSRVQNNDSHDYAFVDEKVAALFDDTRSSLSGEQIGSSSFSVTWNEKSEILEPASEEYVQNGTSETVCRNFNLENEKKEATLFKTDEDYRPEMFLEKFSTNIDLENDEGASQFGTGEGYRHEMSLEALSTNIDPEIVDGASHFDNGETYNHDESLVTFSGNIAQDIQKIGDVHSETAKGYDYDEALQKFSSVHDVETNDREASHIGTAMAYDHDESLETFSTNLDRETEEYGAIQFKATSEMDIRLDNENLSIPSPDDIQPDDFESETVMQKNIHLDSENVPVSTSVDMQHEDVESETDHYVDALNTIESEYDTDLDDQTKRVVEHYSDSESKAIIQGVKSNSGSHPSNSESSIAISSSPILEVSPNPMFPETCSMLYGSLDKVASEVISNSAHFESYVPQPAETVNESLNASCLSDFDSLKIGDALGSSNAKSVMSNVPSNSWQHSSSVPITDMVTSSSFELQKPPPEPSSISSIKFWTNGSLLGLEPSKPPDCSLLNVSSQVPLTSKDSEINNSTKKPDSRDKSPENIIEAPTMECSTSCQGDRRGSILAKKTSWTSLSADLSVNLQKLSDSHNQSSDNSSQKECFTENPGTVQPVTPDMASTKANQDKSGNSSRMFELGNRLLLNGFYRKSLHDKDETSNQTNSSNDIAFELKSSQRHAEHKTFSGRSQNMLGSRSPILSPSSSPPLGHMKMSFQPVYGFQAPKLQLKFPDGNVDHEGGRDLLPSFQLVPEPTVPVHGVGSESDDDTFCRSSAYGSDCPSHQSDSNSEQWESSESPRSKDRELYDALCRISLTESVSTSWETGATNQGEIKNTCRPHNSFTRHSLENSPSGHLFDLPGLDNLHPSLEEEWRNHCDSKDHDDPNCSKELTPTPPQPLPPPRWRAMKSQIEFSEQREVVPMVENLSHEFEWELGHTITQQPKPAPVKQEQIIEAADTLKSKQQGLQKIRVQKEVNRGATGKEMEEQEDFLYQIRTKSFSLRRTDAAKSTIPTGTPTSFQVTAILQKANAIRQAVGSDDGEDDTWSDT